MKLFEGFLKGILVIMLAMLIMVQYLHTDNRFDLVTSQIIKMEGVPANEDGAIAKHGEISLALSGDTNAAASLVVYRNGEPYRNFINSSVLLDVKNHDVLEIYSSRVASGLSVKVTAVKGGICEPAIEERFTIRKGLTSIGRIKMN